MQKNELTIQINKSVPEVFFFFYNPQNTPLWIDSIVSEEVSEWPVKRGSIYRNQDKNGSWSEYVVREWEENKIFAWDKKDSKYHVRYIFTPIDKNTTELKYYEWVDEGKLDDPFVQDILEKLKGILEGQAKLNRS